MEKEFEILEWDSQFFGFNVAKVKKDLLLKNPDTPKLFETLDSQKVKLAYSINSSELFNASQNLYEIKYIVKRIPLQKKVEKVYPIHPNINLYEERTVDPSLIKLAQLAGRQGRFGQDPNIPLELCDKIFESYIVNSVNKKMASHILTYRVEGEIVGFATIDIREDKGYTPLFAVNRAFEGKGISFALMRAAETILKEENCPIAVGGTQKLNVKALKVYQRFGLIPQEPEYVYHLWKK
ncbi:GNAT family N-acetyltransferase [Salinimicrobium sp. 3283s]|uniref:GNAT family N-acetyltransferase n=1 Tax=Salinimicrobium sp. 3283s TaxID=3114359 RepID=UPI0031EE667A